MDGVYVNGHGPYRFLVDTGSNVDFIETRLAASIGLESTFRTELASATGTKLVAGSDGNQVVIDSANADAQEFVISGLDAIHAQWRDVQGIIGQVFLSRFDYMLDFKNKRLEFGTREMTGTRTPLVTKNGRQSVPSTLGDLVLDSGTARMTLFGVRPDYGVSGKLAYQSLNGTQDTGFVSGRPLIIEGRAIRYGEAVAIASTSEPGVSGLLPLSLFRLVYFCNSEGYFVFD